MSFQNIVFRPGVILHEVIAGALRSRGTSLGEWCKINRLPWSTVRNTTFGQATGPRNQALLDRLINDAGREVVAVSYRVRMEAEAHQLAQAMKPARKADQTAQVAA